MSPTEVASAALALLRAGKAHDAKMELFNFLKPMHAADRPPVVLDAFLELRRGRAHRGATAVLRLGGRTMSAGDHSLPAAALMYAQHGLPVFPLAPRSKIPLIPRAKGGRGCHDATTDPDQIARWWSRWPHANIGLACGPTHWVLDANGQVGLDSLVDLQDLAGRLPRTPTVLTPGGGQHHYFAGSARARNSVARIAPGLDVRAAGGSAVAPPSAHPSGGRYRWMAGADPWSCQLPVAPSWLVDMIDPPRTVASPARWTASGPANSAYITTAIARELEAVALAPAGRRNEQLNRSALALGRFVVAGDIDARDLGPAFVGAAIAAGLPEREAEGTITSAFRAALRAAA